MELRGAVAVVTGASAGIGRATAWALAARGASVVLAARRLDRLEELAGRIRERGGAALPFRCDVSEPADVEALRDRVATEVGRCDVLVNNAGIPGGGPFAELPLDRIEQVARTNFLGVLYCTKALLPMMLDQGRGHIVNVASLAGRYAIPGASVYTATKHAVVALSESLHYELAAQGVLVTAVNPGLVATEGFPQAGRPAWTVMRPERIADVIVQVVRTGRAPEVSVPRWLGGFQAVRVLAPGLYRWGVARLIVRSRGPTPARGGRGSTSAARTRQGVSDSVDGTWPRTRRSASSIHDSGSASGSSASDISAK